MGRKGSAPSAEIKPATTVEPAGTSSTSPEKSMGSITVAKERVSGERIKQKKHTRVSKREKELYGLVTPVFLPLLDAQDTSPTRKKEKKPHKGEKVADVSTAPIVEPSSPLRHAEKTREPRKSKKEVHEMEGVVSTDPGKENQLVDGVKKSKRSTVKKSSLKHNNAPRSRRKRVSLVIDGQTVLPADTVVEPSLTSPGSETTSPSNSTASLDDMIDPRLIKNDDPIPHERHDAVHHSLPIPLSHNNSFSPTKPLFDTPSSMTMEISQATSLLNPIVPYTESQAGKPSFLDQPTAHHALNPETADADNIYPGPTESFQDEELVEDPHWNTYVGGLHGSGVDDLDQAGSYGYPSSLGASYLESYMQSRPLSVRMQAATKEGLPRAKPAAEENHITEEIDDADFDTHFDMNQVLEEDDDVDIVGGMEGF